jgi:acetoin utilization deacetylase AcuC-like enzyme
MRACIVYDPIYLEHDTGNHPENSRRLVSIMSYLEMNGVKDKLVAVEPRPATMEELMAVHEPEYIAMVKKTAGDGGGWLDMDTVMSSLSYEAALYAAGGFIRAVTAVVRGECDSAFALVRPPGHHAVASQAMGFCLFNNMAIAAKFALAELNVRRILIVDFDVHHGNGTQDAFYDDPRVLYFSTHQYPFYPGTGWMDEVGKGEGAGATVNFPMAAGWGDDEYLAAFQEVMIPVARRFRPELILVSVGFDPHWADGLAMMQVSVSGFARMMVMLRDLADELCSGRLALTLEGGYNLDVAALSVSSIFDILMGSSQITDDSLGKAPRRAPGGFEERLGEIKAIHRIPA